MRVIVLPVGGVQRIQALQEANPEKGEQLRRTVSGSRTTSTNAGAKKLLTPKKIPDSLSMRATQICIVPTGLGIDQPSTATVNEAAQTHWNPSNTGMTSAKAASSRVPRPSPSSCPPICQSTSRSAASLRRG